MQTTTPPLPAKVAKLNFWAQKMIYALKRMHKQFSDLSHFFAQQNCNFRFLELIDKTFFAKLVLLRFCLRLDKNEFKKILRKLREIL